MEKTVLPFVLILIFMQMAVAQAPPPPPPAKDYSPKLWKEFRSTEAGFRVSFPDKPSESSKTIETSSGMMVLHSWSYGSDKFIYYSVSYRDLLNVPRTENEARNFLKEVRDNRLLGTEDKLKLLSEIETTRDSELALLLEFELFPNRRLRELHVIRGGRHYSAIVITFSNHKAMASTNAYEEIANNFLASFHLIEFDRPKQSVHRFPLPHRRP